MSLVFLFGRFLSTVLYRKPSIYKGSWALPTPGLWNKMEVQRHKIKNTTLQSLSIRFIGKVGSSQIRYQRTPSKGRVSEAALMHYFRKYFFRLLEQKPKSCITQIIHELQAESEEQWDLLAS